MSPTGSYWLLSPRYGTQNTWAQTPNLQSSVPDDVKNVFDQKAAGDLTRKPKLLVGRKMFAKVNMVSQPHHFFRFEGIFTWNSELKCCLLRSFRRAYVRV
uniref:Uncharacterized protein n=1 Tax=Capra hircus TaxID=9925 RepID=A0A8C2P8X4_CAPHI